MKFGTKLLFIFGFFAVIGTLIDLLAPTLGLRSRVDAGETIIVGLVAVVFLALAFWNLKKSKSQPSAITTKKTDADFKLFLGILLGIVLVALIGYLLSLTIVPI